MKVKAKTNAEIPFICVRYLFFLGLIGVVACFETYNPNKTMISYIKSTRK
ncbi:hypothetical protein EDD71_10292 [Fonticella tunisiensis]|uniref:Uncharacterized protein n=1 Tax=Fonticella tunisiensis TaxID=1096341 RepID=A0A4R7KUR2_9CLOT|nr:hypothetical protein EDD71_10292 [Fonticella tunisiensis]